VDSERLIESARAAREHAYAPFSRFAVGAAVVDDRNRLFVGCNVENRSFGLSLCAERAAVAAAVAAGARRLAGVAVVTDTDPPAAPCGLCRETLAEFGDGELVVHLANLAGERRSFRLAELFPEPFRFPASGAP
jgi:cytidine deaminase